MTDMLAIRPRLFGIAYRILGSVTDAEDVVQSAYERFEERRNEELRNSGGWLATVTARLAIDRARALTKQREQYIGVWLPEQIVEREDDPAAQATLADDLAIGFLRVLERLQPEERTAGIRHRPSLPPARGRAIEVLGKHASGALARKWIARHRDLCRRTLIGSDQLRFCPRSHSLDLRGRQPG